MTNFSPQNYPTFYGFANKDSKINLKTAEQTIVIYFSYGKFFAGQSCGRSLILGAAPSFIIIKEFFCKKKTRPAGIFTRCSTESNLAGVAGFEPTNDGVRGMQNTSKMAQKHQKIPKIAHFCTDLLYTPKICNGKIANSVSASRRAIITRGTKAHIAQKCPHKLVLPRFQPQ